MVLTAVVAFGLATPIHAGGMAEPVMSPDVVAEETAASNDGIIVPLMLLLVILAAASNSGVPAP